MATSVRYKELDFGLFETRFLRVINPLDDYNKPLHFDLLTASLSDPPRYNALSYCWGDLSKTEVIEVDGVHVNVSQSLVEALRHSGVKPGGLIWADAICINQSDPYEKTNQIRSMGVIYSKAACTIAWLGKHGAHSENAVSFLEMLGNGPDSISFIDALRSQERPIPIIHGLQDIIMRPYWERAWIIQEISKSTHLTVLCGKFQLDLNGLLDVAHQLKDLPQRNKDVMAAVARFRSQEQRSKFGNPRISLLEALLESRHSLATDPRDKVYALLGLTSDGNDIIPTASYTDSVKTIFENLTATLLATKRPTNVLLLARWASLCVKFPDASSWAVDWADLGNSLPPWMLSVPPLDTQQPSGIELPIGDSGIRAMGRYIGIIEQIEDHSLSDAAKDKNTSSRTPDLKEAAKVMARLRNNLINAVSPRPSLNQPNSDYLSRGLARMLRDVAKGHRTEKYNFSTTRSILQRLGNLNNGRFRLNQWAKVYDIHIRASLYYTFNFIAASREWEETLTKINDLLIFGNRLATIRDGSILVVGSKTKVGDKVYQIDHISLPIILRETSKGDFLIIGEVCLGLSDDLRSWISAMEWLRSPASIVSSNTASKPMTLNVGKHLPEE